MYGGDCQYNPDVDIQQVDQTGFVDLAKAHSMGSVPSMLDVDEVQYNQIDDPNSIFGRPSDDFDAMSMGQALLARVPKKENASE